LDDSIEAAMDVIRGLLWVALGSVFGGITRFWVSGAVARRVGESFPWGTIAVNVSGAFAIGVFAGLASTGQGIFAAPGPWLFAVTGFLGCYTTVSSFSLQTLSLARGGETRRALGNILLSLLLCLAAVALGFFTATRLFT
jgi:fluoride exporter